MRPDTGLQAWIRAVAERTLYLSTLTIGELRVGIDLLADKRKRQDLERWLISDVSDRFRGRIIVFDESVADRWGRLEARARLDGVRLPAIDAMIAATALHHDLTLVTRNERDFERTGVTMLDPWR